MAAPRLRGLQRHARAKEAAGDHSIVPSGWMTRSTGLPEGRINAATASVDSGSSPTSRTPAMLGLRPMPASALRANSRSAPNCPRTNIAVTGMVPATACEIARVTGLQLSITEITAIQLRTPARPCARR